MEYYNSDLIKLEAAALHRRYFALTQSPDRIPV
jgi:hypothetical protein